MALRSGQLYGWLAARSSLLQAGALQQFRQHPKQRGCHHPGDSFTFTPGRHPVSAGVVVHRIKLRSSARRRAQGYMAFGLRDGQVVTAILRRRSVVHPINANSRAAQCCIACITEASLCGTLGAKPSGVQRRDNPSTSTSL